MEIKVDSIKQTLLENRIDDVKKKFPNVNDDFINFFVENDPSGNQKYLGWMVKAINHLPTVHSINSDMLGYDQKNYGTAFSEPHIETANEIVNLVSDFHKLLPYMVHTDDKGKKEGTTDLYQYKFTDSEMIHFLYYDIQRAKERKEKKDKEKELKKGVDKIYEDGNWLVVRPKNWESSCHYGAGTRWCTTSKETSSHFTRETASKFLIYVINKKLESDDNFYKVAWQIPYTRNVDTIIEPLSSEVNMKGLRLWDAQDNDITSLGYDRFGEAYLKMVPTSVKMAIASYMKRVMAEMYKNMGYVEDPHIQALVEHFNLPQDTADEITVLPYTNYGMRIFTSDLWDDITYSVGDADEVYEAKIEWANDFIQLNGVEEAIGITGDPEKYYYIENQKALADELTESYVGDLSEEDIISMAEDFEEDSTEPYKTSLLRYEEDIDREVGELEDSYQNEEITEDDYLTKKNKLEDEKKTLKADLDKEFRRLKEIVRDATYERYRDDMRNPISWLKDWGWWENGKPHPKAFENGMIGIDMDELITDLADMQDAENFSYTGEYWRRNIDNTFYYIFPTDV